MVATGDHFCAQFSASGNSYLQERVLDVRDVCFQLLQHIYVRIVFRHRVS
ncbi:MAG: hypothetical protein ACLR17_12245 [Enterobacteriaceae bacterium]